MGRVLRRAQVQRPRRSGNRTAPVVAQGVWRIGVRPLRPNSARPSPTTRRKATVAHSWRHHSDGLFSEINDNSVNGSPDVFRNDEDGDVIATIKDEELKVAVTKR
jgi:hypothetical protein